MELSKAIESVMPSRVSAILCGASLRFHLSRLLERALPNFPVLAREEIPPGTRIASLAQVAQ